jgi:hypothetical protein
MRLKRGSPEYRARRLYNDVKELSLDLKAIIEEHDRYRLGGNPDRVEKFFESLPIETLRESIDFDSKCPREKYSLRDMHHKFGLRRYYYQKQHELELKQHQLNIAKIDIIISRIKKVEDSLDES